MQIRTYKDAEAALSIYQRPSGGDGYTLDAMRRFMHFIDNPQDKLRVIHVAGTSGKTSTSYYIDALLRLSGYRTGMTVSPHIDIVAERSQVNGTCIEEATYCDELSSFLELVESSGEQLSYFEVLVAFAYWEFDRQAVDFAVAEVGLGGLLDGTNVITRSDKVAVITDIGLDHTEILGDTLPAIAAQKAGIIMQNNVVFMNRQDPSVQEVVEQYAYKNNATFTVIEQQLGIDTPIPLFQVRNLRLAQRVVEAVTGRAIDSKVINKAATTYIPARMEAVAYQNSIVVLDGSHNPQKVAALADSLRGRYGSSSIPVLVSFGTNKRADITKTLTELRAVSDDIILTRFTVLQDNLRQAIDPRELYDICQNLGFESVHRIDDPVEAFRWLIGKDAPVVLVTGSYFLLGHIRPILFNYQ